MLRASPHFVTGTVRPRAPVRLPDREYGLALDCLTKVPGCGSPEQLQACTDMLLTTRTPHANGAEEETGEAAEEAGGRAPFTVLVGRRIVEPQPDWWFVGGRVCAGETMEQSCARLVRRELALSIEPARFRAIGFLSLVWARRSQPPAENGTADLSVTMTCELAPSEVAAIEFDRREYAGLRWLEPEELLAGPFHPALQHACRNLLLQRQWESLQADVMARPEVRPADSAIVQRLRRLVDNLRAPVGEL